MYAMMQDDNEKVKIWFKFYSAKLGLLQPPCPSSNPTPFVGDASPPQHQPSSLSAPQIRYYKAMSGEDALRPIDRGDDWVES